MGFGRCPRDWASYWAATGGEELPVFPRVGVTPELGTRGHGRVCEALLEVTLLSAGQLGNL